MFYEIHLTQMENQYPIRVAANTWNENETPRKSLNEEHRFVIFVK